MQPDLTSLDPKDRRIAQRAALVERRTLELAMLKRQLFGRSREDADQLMVQGQLFAALEVIESAPEDGVVPALPRTPNPDHLVSVHRYQRR
jgi:hypothetical protein